MRYVRIGIEIRDGRLNALWYQEVVVGKIDRNTANGVAKLVARDDSCMARR